jgi:hypothetical protein
MNRGWKFVLIPIAVVVLTLLLLRPAHAIDKSHCGPDGFSPPAPQWVCDAPNEVHQVPEPGSLLLVLVGLVAVRLVRRT